MKSLSDFFATSPLFIPPIVRMQSSPTELMIEFRKPHEPSLSDLQSAPENFRQFVSTQIDTHLSTIPTIPFVNVTRPCDEMIFISRQGRIRFIPVFEFSDQPHPSKEHPSSTIWTAHLYSNLQSFYNEWNTLLTTDKTAFGQLLLNFKMAISPVYSSLNSLCRERSSTLDVFHAETDVILRDFGLILLATTKIEMDDVMSIIQDHLFDLLTLFFLNDMAHPSRVMKTRIEEASQLAQTTFTVIQAKGQKFPIPVVQRVSSRFASTSKNKLVQKLPEVLVKPTHFLYLNTLFLKATSDKLKTKFVELRGQPLKTVFSSINTTLYGMDVDNPDQSQQNVLISLNYLLSFVVMLLEMGYSENDLTFIRDMRGSCEVLVYQMGFDFLFGDPSSKNRLRNLEIMKRMYCRFVNESLPSMNQSDLSQKILSCSFQGFDAKMARMLLRACVLRSSFIVAWSYSNRATDDVDKKLISKQTGKRFILGGEIVDEEKRKTRDDDFTPNDVSCYVGVGNATNDTLSSAPLLHAIPTHTIGEMHRINTYHLPSRMTASGEPIRTTSPEPFMDDPSLSRLSPTRSDFRSPRPHQHTPHPQNDLERGQHAADGQTNSEEPSDDPITLLYPLLLMNVGVLLVESVSLDAGHAKLALEGLKLFCTHTFGGRAMIEIGVVRSAQFAMEASNAVLRKYLIQSNHQPTQQQKEVRNERVLSAVDEIGAALEIVESLMRSARLSAFLTVSSVHDAIVKQTIEDVKRGLTSLLDLWTEEELKDKAKKVLKRTQKVLAGLFEN
ncbi:hypothetical protein BLNAU_7160 [Blattamonas nauphoetae]|uniref:Uncharacterized protein n=1 Tax=Blattamonas nauphoetae TaxID=2049346 RepID=A0ABQ9Y2U8_9EUKA|nr:hypothetical protein BLNAU_7160 [Blattamonas nauphoetae]